MSPGASWKILAQKWLNAQGDIEKLKEFVTFNMAEPWDDLGGSQLDEAAVSSLVRPYAAEVPDDVVLLTFGGDTQENKVGKGTSSIIPSREISVIGWTRTMQIRVIGHWVFQGAPGDPTVDKGIRDFLQRKFSKRDGTQLSIVAGAMDSNGGFPDEVRGFFSKYTSFWAIIGDNKRSGTRGGAVFPSKPSRGGKYKHRFYRIDSQLAKDAIYARLRQTGDQAPMIPLSMPPDYLHKLMCETRVRINGGDYWKPKKGRRAEEEWVCMAYAYAALRGYQLANPSWNDLYLAGGTLGVPLSIQLPEAGGVGFKGPDRSAHALERMATVDPMIAVPELPRGAESKKVPAQAADQMAGQPAAPVVQKPQVVKRKQVVKSFKSSRW
jgi:phage terminase large subunit GpA-like protein